MRDDAAAAARRIVEEVLARHGQGDEPATGTVSIPVTSNPTDDVGEEPEPSARHERPDDEVTHHTPAGTERPEVQTELLAAAGEAASAAAQIARRIVGEALAEAEQRSSGSSAGEREDPRPEVAVRGVPAEGLAVEDEQTVGIEVSADAADTDHPADSVDAMAANAPSPPGTPPETVPSAEAPASGSVEEIVRRIVADVQSEAPTSEEGTAAQGRAAPDDEPESRWATGTTAMLEEQRPGTDTAALPQHQSVAVGAPSERRAETPAAPAATAVPSRELEGWAAPMSPEPGLVMPPAEGAPRTLRWLLASLLGAVALAVLFPLAVAALRALVAMD